MHQSGLLATGVALLATLPCAQAAMYTKNSPVLQVDSKSYDKLIAKSNYTSVVEFYAPWCGHCQNLKPAYEKAAKNLEGLANVAAVNCDEDENKPLCGSMGVKGFPTLKIVRPGKKTGRPVVEDYNGARSATAIVEAVVDKINNHVKRVTDKEIETFLSDKPETPKAILFTEKGTTSALLKSVAIDFLDVITVAQIRNKEVESVKKFNIAKFPTLILLLGGDKEPIVYDGDMKKEAIVTFLSQAGAPNSAAAAKGKAEKKSEKKTEKKTEKKSKSTKAEAKTAATEEAASEPSAETSTSSAAPVPTAEPIPALTAQELGKQCLGPKSTTCLLALTPAADATSDKALKSLADLAHKYIQGKRHLIPFFQVADDNTEAAKLRKELALGSGVELVAVNARRSWWRHYEGDLSLESIESWLDGIRMGEGKKQKLPAGLVAEVEETSSEAQESSSSTAATEPTPEAETATEKPAAETPPVHEEL